MTSDAEKEPLGSLGKKVSARSLSFAQQRLWFLHQLEPDSPVYNQFNALRLRGRLNREALQKALDSVIARHEALRTTFSSFEGKPAQVIHAPDNVELSVIDLLPDLIEHRQEALDRLMSEIIRRPFDLEKDWPLRTALIQLGNDEHVLLLVAHHIASDGWSNDILFRELSALYEAFCQGKRSPLEKLPVQYADYAVWQKEWLQGEILQQQLSYWKKQLEDISPLELPTDRPRPAVQGHLGRTKTFTFPQASAESLKALSRQEGVTLFMTLLAAFQTLLHRYTAQDDIAVGCPIAGRNRMEFEGLIGFFVNTLVLRNDFSGNPMFRQFLARVKENALDAYAHQDIPFEKLVAELQPARDLSRNPFFQVLFQLRNYPARTVSAAGLNIEEYEFYSDIAKFDLSVALRDTGIGLSGTIEYRTDLFDSATIERMLGHFRILLEGIVRNPEQRISELPLLAELERDKLLVEWNDTETDYLKDKCIHELFEAQVEKTPDAIAVVFEDQQLTYRELNTRANQLAHHLRKRGVRPESLIAVCMERSLEMVIGILGVVKAGGAYVPIDPETPTDRLKFMLQDAQAALILTQERFSSLLAEFTDQRVCLDSAWDDLSLENKENPENLVDGKNAAYMIYTSGSTGTPKGVVNVHGGLRNRLQWMQDAYGLKPADRVLQKTPFTFDVSVWEFFWPLISGAGLVIARPGGHRDSAYLVQLIQSERITLLHFVPSMLGMFLQEEGVESCATLRQVICSGEALSHELQQRFFERTGVALSNLYGPTEASIDVTAWECRSDSDRTIVPIGRPIANTQVYILDGDLNPLPIGVVGEIYIGGDGVARGYLNRPELTAEKFIPDPFSNEPGARIYKTGDLARYLPDGNIDFLGRTDHQVKIRGYRIELGEIEAVLAQHPTIKESVVLAREDTAGDQRLVAYVVGAGGSQPSAHDLRRFLQQKLPEYMVPSAFIFLESLPLTPSGKLDRKALPAPDQTRPELEETYSPPRTPVEESLAQIWCDVLKLDQVGVHDNFFDLGGHSLTATQLISRIRDTFKLDLPLRNLFEAPTVGEFAARIGSAHERKVQSRSLSILPEPLNKEYLMSFSQERFWFLERLEPNNSAYKIYFELNLTGSLDIEALEKSLAEIARRHESLRTTCHESHGVPVQIVSEQWSFRLNVIDVRQVVAADLETEVRRLLEKEYRRPFNLSTDLLLRGTLLRLSGSEHLLLISSHHVAWDHWSIAVFFRELSVLYQAFAAGKPSPLVELPIQYKHYALWQRENVQGAEFDNQLAYWKRQLADIPSRLDLPADHPRKPLSARRGGRQALVLAKELSSALRFLGKEANVTLFMIFLAAYQTLLHRITGEDDIVVGTPVAGRDRYETEGLIGLFLNSLAMRANFSSNPSFLELLARVREVALEAYEHQDLPFEKLVEELQPARDLTTTPIFQVFINMYNFKEDELNLEGLTVQPLKRRADAPQFDLELYIREHPDGTHLSFVYDSELFEAKTIERMLGHFRILLEGIVGNPEQRISELPLLSDAEKQQLLVEWNDTHKDYPRDKCIHELFEAQVEQTPDAIALVFEDQQLTYRELNTRANQLALYLRHIGVGPDVLVGFCVERSIEMIVGLLGILKAGGAYVPLDPAYPKERLAFMLEDAKVKVLLTQQQFLSSINHPRVVCLDNDWHKIATQSTHNPKSNIHAHNLAYVIYTSGSTGIPKGVMIQHRSVVNFLASMAREPGLSETDILLAVTTVSFDIAGLEIYLSLSVGARVVLARREIAADGSRLAQLLSDSDATAMQATPATWLMLLASGWQGSRELKILCGGEALRGDLATQLEQRCASLWNMYGPTETTIWSAVRKVTANVDGVSLGRPIANTQIYILDKYMNPVPIGVPGELHIGGDGLARGYWNCPELTQAKFIANPFSDRPSTRLYKTGDVARYFPDGNIEFLGRVDHQVKIRGYRIELGEIEVTLGQHPSIREFIVLAREDIPGNLRLVAYVVAAAGRAPSVNELRSFLQQKLPEYMVPSAFVFMESLPITPNGKLDRKALPAPDQTRPELDETYSPPRTPVEKSLAQIWCDVLKLDQVGVHDNFFDLGGHSLLAIQVISRIRDTFKLDLPLRSLFEAPTIDGLAQRVQELGAQDVMQETKITRVAREPYRIQ